MNKKILTILLVFSLGFTVVASTNTNLVVEVKSDRYILAIKNNDAKLMRKTREYRQAMNSYRKSHPDCEVTGLKPSFWGRNPDVHHYVPVSVDITLACDTNNMITLCRDIHFLIGHLSDWTDDNVNFRATKIALWKAVAENGKSRKGNNKLLLRLHAEIEPYIEAEEGE